MADYNVQMKQYNGTGFDNILPYASQAETLRGGGTASDLITQARAGLCQIATGSYVGTGTYGEDNPTVINCGFKPKMVLFYLQTKTGDYGTWTSSDYKYCYGSAFIGWMDGVESTMSGTIRYNVLVNGLSFYADVSRNQAQYQNNISGQTYFYLAIG